MLNGPTVYKLKRILAKFSQEMAAELLDISTRSLQYIEAGKREPRISIAFKMAEIYCCNILDFKPVPLGEGVAKDDQV